MVKVGPKGKHRKIPDGWSRVTEGPCCEGDMYANCGFPTDPHWKPVEWDFDEGSMADDFECLIRKDKCLKTRPHPCQS